MPAIETTLELLFVKVTVCVAVAPVWTSPKAREAGEKATSTPVPVNCTLCGLPNAECVIVTAPALGPALVGVNVTDRVHTLEKGESVVQVPDCEKAKSPLATMPVIVIEVLPTLRIVKFFVALVVFTG